MTYIICIVCFTVFTLIFIQFRILYKSKKESIIKRKQLRGTYSVVVATTGDRMMQAVKEGKVKKQLLPNDAPKYSSVDVLNGYVTFVDHSNMYEKIVMIEESRFDG